MKNYSPRQKNFTPPSVQPKRNNVITPNMKARDTKEEYYCGTRCDTFLPSVSDLPLPPTEWIDPNRSKSTPNSPVPAKPCITATKSIDIAAIFGSAPAHSHPQPAENRVSSKTRKSSSYPGEKPKRFEENRAPNNNNKGQNPKEARPQVQKTATPPAAPQKTTSNPTAAAASSFTPVKSPLPTEISADLMKMLGVVPVKSPQKIASPGCMPRTGSPQKYQEITNNLKNLLKVQA